MHPWLPDGVTQDDLDRIIDDDLCSYCGVPASEHSPTFCGGSEFDEPLDMPDPEPLSPLEDDDIPF